MYMTTRKHSRTDSRNAALLHAYREDILDLYAQAREATQSVLWVLEDETVLTCAEVALAIMHDIPNVSYVYNLIHTGDIAAVRRGRPVRVTAAEVREFLTRRDGVKSFHPNGHCESLDNWEGGPMLCNHPAPLIADE
jgi:excisionase family DNA binding protein